MVEGKRKPPGGRKWRIGTVLTMLRFCGRERLHVAMHRYAATTLRHPIFALRTDRRPFTLCVMLAPDQDAFFRRACRCANDGGLSTNPPMKACPA